MDPVFTDSRGPDETPPTMRTALLPALRDLGMPVFLFGVVFLGLTIGMTALLSPDRFPVHVAGKVIRLADLAAEEDRLHTEQNELTLRRQELIASQDAAPVLQAVMERKAEIFPVGSVLLGVEAARLSLRTNNLDPISLPRVEYRSDTHLLTLGGAVTDPTGGSNHLLSAFVDLLRELPLVTSVSEPEYTQELSETGVPRTPFTLTLRLSHDQ